MKVDEAYNLWADQYDTNSNRTRDVEALALQQVLENVPLTNVLEVGCGTGKNTQWLATKATGVLGVDFSEEMLRKAKAKTSFPDVQFVQADILNPWNFTDKVFGLVTFSLVLEHIYNLEIIFREAKNKLESGGYLYIGELHPFKQYTGSVARFDSGNHTIKLKCYTHHISEFVTSAQAWGFKLIRLNEWFDDENKTSLPRILTMLFKA